MGMLILYTTLKYAVPQPGNIPNESSGPEDFRSVGNFCGKRVENGLKGGIAANPCNLTEAPISSASPQHTFWIWQWACMLEFLYLDIRKCYYATCNFSATGSRHCLLCTQVANGENYDDNLVLDFPIPNLWISKHSYWEGGLNNSPTMYLKNLRVLAISNAEIITVFSDIDVF